jgi:hypothetical protein
MLGIGSVLKAVMFYVCVCVLSVKYSLRAFEYHRVASSGFERLALFVFPVNIRYRFDCERRQGEDFNIIQS